jgi:hypothetical protein
VCGNHCSCFTQVPLKRRPQRKKSRPTYSYLKVAVRSKQSHLLRAPPTKSRLVRVVWWICDHIFLNKLLISHGIISRTGNHTVELIQTPMK